MARASLLLALAGARTPRRAGRRRGEAGFSLIEVVVALALLGLVLAVLTDSVRTGLSGASRAAALAPPLALAEAKLAAVGITAPLSPGATSGEDAGGIAWRVVVDDYRDDGVDAPSSDAPGVPKLYRVRVTATWQQRGAPRSLSLDSLRLAAPHGP
jgi:prepilin-type N-terminal cleavage/methylation domain-containing protein